MKVGIFNNLHIHTLPIPKQLFSKDYFDVKNDVFHVFRVNRSVNMFLLNTNLFYVTKIC